MADTADLVNFALDKNPVEFANAFDALMRQKAVDAIENQRMEIAQSIYTPSREVDDQQQFEPDYTEDDLDELDVDIDEFEDIDDIDDLDDLDDIDTFDGEDSDG